MNSLRFGTLFRLDVTPRDQALAEPSKVTHSGKVNKAVTDAEFVKTGKRGNQHAFFLNGEFYSVAGRETQAEMEQLEQDYFERLPKLEQFVLEHADDEEQVAELLGEDRFKAIKAGAEQNVQTWIAHKLQTEGCPVVRIDLNA